MGKVTLKVTLKAEPNESGLHNVRIRITKDRKPRYYGLSPFVKPRQFNPNGKRDLQNWIRPGHDSAPVYNNIILTALQRCEGVVEHLDKTGNPYSVDDVIAGMRSEGNPETVSAYMRAFADRRMKLAGKDLGKIRTAINYQRSLHIWDLFEQTRPKPVTIQRISKRDVEEFKAWMEARFPSGNSTAGHLTKLKTVLRVAMADGLISADKNPMKGIKFAMKRKKVSRLQSGDIDKIESHIDSPRRGNPGRTITPTEHARPLALAMYYLHGSRIGDVILLRRRNYVVEGDTHRVVFVAGKNKQEKNILLADFVVELLSPYLTHPDGTPKKPAEFLFPYMTPHFDALAPIDQVQAIKHASQRAYGQIKRMGVKIGLEQTLNPHLFRHSFADMLRREGEDLLTIQMVMLHADPRTTRDYMESMDQTAVDRVSGYYARHRGASTTVGKQKLNNDGNTLFSPEPENDNNGE